MHRHRNSNIRAKLITWFVTAIFCSCNSYGFDASQKKETLINNYMKFAFAKNEKLVKFSQRPVVSFFCLSSYCKGVAEEVATHFPKKTKYLISETLSPEPDISILFAGPKSAKEIDKLKYPTNNGRSLSSWGKKSCSVFQIRRNDTIEKAVIVLNESEGRLNNITCILYELPRASGGNNLGRYEEYSQTLSKLPEQSYEQFILGVEFILRMHWSELIPPGTDKKSTLQLIQDNIQ